MGHPLIKQKQFVFNVTSNSATITLTATNEFFQTFDEDRYSVHSTNHTYIEWWDPKIKKIVQQELYELKNGFEEINIFEEKSSKNIIQKFSEKINHYNSRFNLQ